MSLLLIGQSAAALARSALSILDGSASLRLPDYEEVLRNEYRDLADARASIREFLEKVYNQTRLHSALGYMPPARFEANQKDAAARRIAG
jgi:transposase InsO family protein